MVGMMVLEASFCLLVCSPPTPSGLCKSARFCVEESYHIVFITNICVYRALDDLEEGDIWTSVLEGKHNSSVKNINYQ